MLTATNSPLEVRAAEAIRFALERTLGRFGTLYASISGQPTLIVADISLEDGATTPVVGESLHIGEGSHVITEIEHSETFPAGFRITVDSAATATAGSAVYRDLSALIRRADDTRSREGLDWLAVVQVIGLREAWAGANQFSGTLIVGLDAAANTIPADDGEALDDAQRMEMLDAHHARIAALNAVLDDVQSIADFCMFNAERCVEDFTLYGLYDAEEPGGATVADSYTFEVRRRIACARVDDFAAE